MSNRIAKYQIGEVSRMSGVSVRRLRHYDEIGLLSAVTAENGYRYYDDPALERLQEILFYRAFGFGLTEIRALLDDSQSRLTRLTSHRSRLREQQKDLSILLASLDHAISAEQEGARMEPKDLYKPFSQQKQAEYESWLIDTYGAHMAKAVAVSQAHLATPPDGLEERMTRLKSIETALVAAFQNGEADVTYLLDDHRAWVASMWGQPCPKPAYAGLADMYLAHPDFVARYEALAPKFSQWLPAQMKAYAAA